MSKSNSQEPQRQCLHKKYRAYFENVEREGNTGSHMLVVINLYGQILVHTSVAAWHIVERVLGEMVAGSTSQHVVDSVAAKIFLEKLRARKSVERNWRIM